MLLERRTLIFSALKRWLSAEKLLLHRPKNPQETNIKPSPITSPIKSFNKNEILNQTLTHPLRKSRILCHELRCDGKLLFHGRDFNKSLLCTTLGLMPRDLRKLDGTLKDQLPTILIRNSAILVNLTPFRVIIKHDGIILFEEQSEQEIKRSNFIEKIRGRLTEIKTIPFEFIAIEVLLKIVIDSLEHQFEEMSPKIEVILKDLERSVHWKKLRILLTHKKQVNQFNEHLSNIRECLRELLDSDTDMSNMYLNEKAHGRQRSPQDHEDVELLLENYLKLVEEISSHTQMLLSNIESTEDFVNIALVGQRNELLLLELRLGIGTFSASMGGFGASILGMNLANGWEHDPWAFWMVLGSLVSISGVSFAWIWRLMIRLIKQT